MTLSHLLRLVTLWSIAARFRLDTLITQALIAPPFWIHLISWSIRLHPYAWFSRAHTTSTQLSDAFEAMGPLFIKAGQLLATRHDLLPESATRSLANLQDRVKPVAVSLIRDCIVRELGAPIDTLFARFDDVPLAAASIAQIHTAQLQDGREVIVKVVRPRITKQLTRDFNLLIPLGIQLENRLAGARAIRLSQLIADYRHIIFSELNLTIEAQNTRLFRANFANSPDMYVPEIYEATRGLIVAERITGVPISRTDIFDKLGMDRAALAEKGLRIFFTQVFEHNFFHADMHPGNVFVETLYPENPRYISLDCAIAGELSRRDQMTIARVVLAVTQMDFALLVHIFHQAGWVAAHINQTALARELEYAVGPMISKPMSELNFAPILMEVMQIARHYHLDMPPQLMLLIKTLIHVEGLGRDLYPSLDIWKLAEPILSRWIKNTMNPAQLWQHASSQIPQILLGATDIPKLLTDSLHGLGQHHLLMQRQISALQDIERGQLLRHNHMRTTLSVAFVFTVGAYFSYGIWQQLCATLSCLWVIWRLLRA